MAKGSGARKRTKKLPAGRVGRPPMKSAGEVDELILGAARRVFLERGLAGASIDEIASIARWGMGLHRRLTRHPPNASAQRNTNTHWLPNSTTASKTRSPPSARWFPTLGRGADRWPIS